MSVTGIFYFQMARNERRSSQTCTVFNMLIGIFVKCVYTIIKFYKNKLL